jgi:hypothetical protein
LEEDKNEAEKEEEEDAKEEEDWRNGGGGKGERHASWCMRRCQAFALAPVRKRRRMRRRQLINCSSTLYASSFIAVDAERGRRHMRVSSPASQTFGRCS